MKSKSYGHHACLISLLIIHYDLIFEVETQQKLNPNNNYFKFTRDLLSYLSIVQ